MCDSDALARRGGWTAARLLAVVTAAGLCSCEKPAPQPPQAPQTQPAAETQQAAVPRWQTPFDGKTLTGWKVPEWGGSGKVYVKDGLLHMEDGITLTGATYTGEVIRDDYELTLEAKRIKGTDFFCGLTFPVGKDCISLILGGWGGMVVGLSSLDGLDASENETCQVVEFESDRWYRVRVEVTKAKIVCWLDDKQIISVDRKDREIGVRMEMDLSEPLGVATYQTHGAIRNLRIERVEE